MLRRFLKLKGPKSFKGLWRHEGGSSAVEFAMIAAPLFFAIFACIELALVIVASVSLDNATASAARKIRMGITTAGNSSAASFKTEICNNMGWLAVSCAADLKIDVKTYTNFALVPTTDPIVAGAFDASDLSYQIGTGSQIQLVRIYYQWTMITPFLTAGMTTLGNGKAVLSSKVVFRNEPF